MERPRHFEADQIRVMGDAASVAEELVAEAYKMSANQWLRHRYDVCTLAGLEPGEIVCGPFAQIVRYRGQKHQTSLGSASYDFYKICLQDHAILDAVEQRRELSLYPFALYVLCHELVHVVRFSLFLQHFDATWPEKMAEERRVHEKTRKILEKASIPGLSRLLKFYRKWQPPPDAWAAASPADPPPGRIGGLTTGISGL
ncbi:MAG: hypothetical protein KKA60_06785 [Proteobacteria bacterium]|nr:hypothetical protein [Pseudomonadota bacterium]